jgi:nitronate monooxygenase
VTVTSRAEALAAADAGADDPDRMALWAGTNHALAQDAPAGRIVHELAQ